MKRNIKVSCDDHATYSTEHNIYGVLKYKLEQPTAVNEQRFSASPPPY